MFVLGSQDGSWSTFSLTVPAEERSAVGLAA